MNNRGFEHFNIRSTIKFAIVVVCLFMAIGLLYLNPFAIPQLLEPDWARSFGLTRIWIARVLDVIGLFSLSCFAFVAYVVRSELHEKIKNTLLVLYTFFVVFLLIEGVFTFIPYSHGVGYTLASRNWFHFYWRTNSLGYRDTEYNSQDDSSKTKIIFIGDSFTAGQGIREPEKRYTDQLKDRLPDRYRVYNLGKTGSDTRNEYQRLISFPVKPDIVVLQYFGNDILESALEAYHIDINSSQLFTAYSNVPGVLRPLVKGSYLINYFYWKFPQADMGAFNDTIIHAYRNPDILRRHLKDLDRFIEYTSQIKAQLIIAIFPYLNDIEGSKVFVDPVESHFIEKNICVLNLTASVLEISPQNRTVNTNDAHPSELLHKAVADTMKYFLDKYAFTSK